MTSKISPLSFAHFHSSTALSNATMVEEFFEYPNRSLVTRPFSLAYDCSCSFANCSWILALQEERKLACSFLCQCHPALENRCDSCNLKPVWKHPGFKREVHQRYKQPWTRTSSSLKNLAGIPSAPVALDHASIVLSILKTSSTDSFLKLKWLSASWGSLL